MVIYNITNKDIANNDRAETADVVDGGMFNESSDDFGDDADGNCGGDSDSGGVDSADYLDLLTKVSKCR